MRPERGAGGELALAGTAGHTTDDAPSIAALAPRGNYCTGCGIATTGTTLHCPTCSAWRRWYSAHRIASRALREASR